MYALGLEPGTAMRTWVDKGKLPVPDDDLAADMYDLATSVMKQNNYAQYEISNWAKPGYDCQHNLQYWRNLPYLGFGPGAHGFTGGVRYSTVLSPLKYVEVMNKDRQPHGFPFSPATSEARWVTVIDEMSETLMMSLRLTREGVQRDVFRKRFGIDVMDLHGPMLTRRAADGLLEIQPDLVRLTERGRLLSNVIFRELV
jgi:oxygen-independent coproporphyrinogen-3 oxidase